MGSTLLCLLFLASLATVLNAQLPNSEPDPAYAVLLQRFFNSLPTMIQSQLEGNPEKFTQILSNVMGDGLLGKLLSDPIQGVAKGLTTDGTKDNNSLENGVQKLWSSINGKTTQVGSSTVALSPTTPATAITVAIPVPQPVAPAASEQSLTTDNGKIDEKKLAEAFLDALKKSVGSTTPSPMDYVAQFLQPKRIDFSTDGSQDYLLPGRNQEPFRRAPSSQRYQYLMKEYQNLPIEEQVLDEVNQESILAYAQALRNKQMAFLANHPQPQQQWQQRLPATQSLSPDELIRMHELLKMYEAKISQPNVASGANRGGSSRMRSTEYEDDDQQKPQLELDPSSLPEPTRRGQSHPVIFPDMVTPDSTAATLASSVTADAKSISSDETETLASAFNISIPEQQLTEIDNQCGCVPLDLNLMEGHWVQALGNTENVKRIYKGALHLMQESNKVDLKPTCARFKFEQPIDHSQIGQEANVTWTFKTSETGKPYTMQGTVATTDHRTVQLQLEGPGSYKFNLPVCAQKTGTTADGSKYSFVVLAETVGADKCRSAHVLVRNPAAFFHERNEELIGFLKSRIESDVMKPVSVVPFGSSCD